MVKKDFLYRILIYIIMVGAILLPWFTEGKYNQDLLVIVVYLQMVHENTTFLEAFSDNMTFIYLIRKCFSEVSPYTLVFILHNISVLLLTFTLKKYLKPIYVCAIMLFTFFTIFCNQFRLAYALAIGLRGFMLFYENKIKGILLLLLSLVFHFFVAFLVFGIFLLELYNRGSKWVKRAVVFLMLATLFMGYLFVTNNIRFSFYLISDESGYVSITFILIIIAVLILWKSIDKGKRFFVFSTLLMVIITAPLANISSRLGELLFIIMLFMSRDAVVYDKRYLRDGKQLMKPLSFIYFMLGAGFFVYRFYNWVILDNVIRPDVLDYLK